jgi:cob(I)alamin adenosyltransferase
MLKDQQQKTFDKMTPEEKEQLAKEHLEKHKQWLFFIIKDKYQSLSEYQGKPKQCRILANEIKHYEKELSILQGFTQKPSEFEDMSPKMLALHDKLINKNIVLIACKKDQAYCDYIRAEIRVIERQIKALEVEENGTTPEDPIPF